MQYLCLVYFEPEVFERMSPEEKRALDRDSLAYDNELRASGHYLRSNALQSVEQAITVRVRNDRMSSTDGPFAETKEHLGGFILIEAATWTRRGASPRAYRWPRYGSIEVRPIYRYPEDHAMKNTSAWSISTREPSRR